MRDPAKTKETLLQTAMDLVRQSSYESVGVNEICSRAGVTKGAFYHHFESKADLYAAAADHYWHGMKQALDGVCSPATPPLEQLETLIDFVVSRQKLEADHINAVSPETAEPTEVVGCPFFTCGVQVGAAEPKVRDVALEMAARGIRYYEALVRALKADGVLDDDPDPAHVARLLFQYMHGVIIYGRIKNDLAVIETDMREGFYRILGLKTVHRRAGRKAAVAAFA